MARTKTEDGKISKAAAYREAAAALGEKADLDAVHNFILEKFSINMDKTQISQYRSNEKSRTRKGKRGRKPKQALAAKAPKVGRGDSLLEFISTVKGWENKLGADKICEVIGVLYKKI